MIVSARALSYEDMKKFTEKTILGGDVVENIRIVSIIDPSKKSRTAYPHIFPKDTNRIIRFAFGDIDPDAFKGTPLEKKVMSYHPMRLGQAETVVDHIIRWHTEEDRVDLYVNCMAGVSRSAAVCEFARRVCNLDDEQFKKDNPVRYPNGHVLRLLMRSWMAKT